MFPFFVTLCDDYTGAMTISVRNRHEDDGGMSERPVVNENAEPVVAFGRPPSIPPFVGPLVLLALLEMGSDDE